MGADGGLLCEDVLVRQVESGLRGAHWSDCVSIASRQASKWNGLLTAQ